MPYILGKYFAVIDSIEKMKVMEEKFSEKGAILQHAFESGEPYAGTCTGDGPKNGAVSH